MAQNQTDVIKELQNYKETLWMNPNYQTESAETEFKNKLSPEKIEEARQRLLRFAPYLIEQFPETKATNGLVESPLWPIPKMKKALEHLNSAAIAGDVFIKLDSQLAIAGSVKGRGGVYEVLTLAERIALENGLLSPDDDYQKLADSKIKEVFNQYTIQVGSTGNLGLSIGIISAKIGFKVIVHMSSDAKEWKKQLLREKDVHVIEYENDYSEAVEAGRKQSDADPKSYFIDDENSVDLFLGYATAASYLQKQLEDANIEVSEAKPLFVYLPCGVGGAPGGITYGLKQIFGDHVHCFFIEPTKAPCMLLGMATEKHDKVSIQDYGIDGRTAADGLAVGRPSSFIGKVMTPLLSGVFTVEDSTLFYYLQTLYQSENVFIEPSAAAGFIGLLQQDNSRFQTYIHKQNLQNKMNDATHIIWATGGRLVPNEERDRYLKMS
ncbi:serine dehydratase [Alkalihalobacillus alcalophilus ATCC 27647 = CGMCC 1.3604]|uniref:Probable D-serine dehydratase n=1 Tax=Alkalihalobacillus alcalophilus ATCC 27647 = CGMCC 1.3604 TaxID=1218173 RepID=A0A094WCT0_ALKAL|nr:D-serine ammonia-lyase [Alkalihalobacillus alcalophilus]KGA95589.1 serine ammonia-lyase [Alkalihalobacillus alcalophilus ATCC 27647 = CGMCC 1.3604]MED1564047.1 D-serine ammonia-lyase [Alkalihalobacillus alcalophilus]THG88751.1 serine dehydratase [Alkalihalobacillus alcalophilus ATCC 27647 = CGMCC 1.3604]